MNRYSALAALSVLLLLGAGTASAERHEGEREGSRTVYRRRRVAVPAPAAPEHMVRDQNRAVYPQRDEAGRRISQQAAAVPPVYHRAVVQNQAVVGGIQRQQRSEVVPNHYYWHKDGGVRYSHYYDGRNHWYGFYHGPTFYWTRFYGDHWWWYDGRGARWVYWWNGYWWWPGDGGRPYVYVDDAYYPYEGTGVAVESAETPAAPATVPAADGGAATVSPDGTRKVQISGAEALAFLFDMRTSPPKFLKYLGQGVVKARFAGGTAGAPLQLLIEYKDDSFALFDGDGNSQSAAVRSTEAGVAAPPDVPDTIPPPPTSAPGQ
ncbi:MAG: hypothetical protein ACHQ51_01630 [Elusimicrobiota bacterium]